MDPLPPRPRPHPAAALLLLALAAPVLAQTQPGQPPAGPSSAPPAAPAATGAAPAAQQEAGSAAPPAAAQAPATEASALMAALPTDPTLEALVAEALAARPELAQEEAGVRAARERVPQAGALPDPTLTLGIQNDGFDGIMIGEMEGSYWSVMASQGLPFPGKRGLRTQVAALEVDAAQAGLARARLSTEAEVRRAYLDLLLVRERLELLARQEVLWQKSSGVARVRYEAGEGAQSDVLRAQLELNRLRQRRWALVAEERTRVQALNRLRGKDVSTPIPTATKLRTLAPPTPQPPGDVLAHALAHSPELAQARAGVTRAERGVALARRERLPDFTLSAGVMPRGGDFPPMWTASVGVTLPVFSGRKQGRAVAERQAQGEAEAARSQAVEQTLRLRVEERAAALSALHESLGLYRDGLLVQSAATSEATLAQYRVGRASFASVLEAHAGLIGDEDGYLTTLAAALRLAIASAELSLEPAGGVPGAGLGSGAMSTGAAGVAPSSSSSSSTPAAGAAPAANAPSMGGM